MPDALDQVIKDTLDRIIESRASFNGKPFEHWEQQAKRLVIYQLIRAAEVDTRSLPGLLAHQRIIALARAEDPELVTEVLAAQERPSLLQVLRGDGRENP